jgi:hypothetical protein
MNFASVDKDGAFNLQGDMRVLYSTMMLIRCAIVSEVSSGLYKAL